MNDRELTEEESELLRAAWKERRQKIAFRAALDREIIRRRQESNASNEGVEEGSNSEYYGRREDGQDEVVRPAGNDWGGGACEVGIEARQNKIPDHRRRLKELRALGGDVKWFRNEWSIKGITKLVKQEKAEGRPRSDEKTIRIDLKQAAEEERKSKRKGSAEATWHPE